MERREREEIEKRERERMERERQRELERQAEMGTFNEFLLIVMVKPVYS